MNETKNIINPFIFYPSNKKTNIMTKKFPLVYDQNTNTWIMEGNGIRLINIPNDIWVVSYLKDYVCSFFINAEAITTALRLIQEDGSTKVKKVALARVFAFLYGNIPYIEDYRSEANFEVKHHFDENNIMIQDVSPNNISISHDKDYLEDDQYTYFKIYGVNYYARVNKYIRDFFIENCTNIRYTDKKWIRSSIKGSHNTVSLNNIVYKMYNPNLINDHPFTKLLNYDIQYNEQLNIYYIDFSIENIYYGNDISMNGQYTYIFMQKDNISAILDSSIYLKHKNEISRYVWYINNEHVCANGSRLTVYNQNITLHRLIIRLLFEDYNLDYNIMTNMHIHHIDENPLNNSIDNLFICSNDIHGYIHNKLVNDLSTIVESNVMEILNLGYIPDKYIKLQK